ncbi:DUF393 domain-containing protein [Pedobacter gandavensis]|uniref:thiol-disulfide oxidoreductase DCC family protein n=1 Tax=Pedobacter gandavensis TaxID=2679963 RepID=UPI0029302EFC|nr:DUF393 domain-containing protein [Pedobacter gandavensis]
MIVKAVIFFDGICNLCNDVVQFVIKRDKKGQCRFTTLDGEYAKNVLGRYKVDLEQMDSILLLEGDKLYSKSTAALRILKKMDGAWPVLYCFIVLPESIRDRLYDLIAKNRYLLLGRSVSCWVRTTELNDRFFP